MSSFCWRYLFMRYRLLSRSNPLDRLHVLWWLFVLVECSVVVICYWFLYRNIFAGHRLTIEANQWLVQAALVIGIELWVVRRNLPKNHRRGEIHLLPTLGMGNGLTLTRGLAYALMAGFLFAPRPGDWLAWAPAILYTLACFADFFDGYLARKTNHSTLLGEVLDIEFDGLGMLIGIGLAIQYGQLPFIYLLIGIARPLFVLGLQWRQRQGLPEYPMTPSSNRRLVAGVHMGFMMFVLWPVFTPPATTVAAIMFGMPIVLSFLRDWLVVIGWIDPTSARYQHLRRRSKTILFEVLPIIVRIGATVIVAQTLWRVLVDPSAWQALLDVFGAAQPALAVIILGLGGIAAIAAALGIVSRLAGIALILVACVDFLARALLPDNGILLILGVLLVFLGGGRLALWQPEEYLFHNQLGRSKGALARE
jgi:CDP-diacylglycerol--glycerol-3-phosphate 3-phosphatidyltransferase